MLRHSISTPATLALGLCLLGACTDDAGGSATTAPEATDESGTGTAAESTYTWHADIAPIVAEKCANCHVEDDIAPFPLTSYAEAAAVASILAPAIEAQAMPPWPPSSGCNEYSHDRSLSDAQREMLLTWIDEDAPEGDPSEAAPLPEPPEPWVADAMIEMPVAYTPTQEPDDYRCFLVDGPELEDTSFVTGFEVYPGERSIVHHVIAFVVDPENVADFEAYDEADPGPGYGCFGGPKGDTDDSPPGMGPGVRWVGSWAPGSVPVPVPEGTGMRLEPGSKIVFQMHYNTSSATPIADRTSMGLTLTDSVERRGMVLPFTNFAWILGLESMSIPAGESSVEHGFVAALDELPYTALLQEIGAGPDDTLSITDVGLHMHLLGRKTKLSIQREGGGETCLLDIDDWDFGWQGDFSLREPVSFEPGDKLSLSCEWDNSESNQPVIDGQIADPHDVGWGDGSFDEMCLSILYVSKQP